MRQLKKLILFSMLTFLLSFLICLIYFKGAITLTLDVIKNLNKANKSIETFSEIRNYYGLNTMDIKSFKYKDCDKAFIDIFSSHKKNEPSPVIIYLHGGAWVYGNNDIPLGMEPLIDALNDKGYTIISLSYELLEDNSFIDKPISDVKDLVRWINKNKETYNFNINDIGIIGVSSGAHLGMMAAYSKDDEFLDDENLKNYSSKVKYVIDIFGPTDLKSLDFNILKSNLSENTEVLLTDIDSIKIINSLYSPLNYIDSNSPKTLIIHSKEDIIVPYENALKLFNKLDENKTNPTLLSLTKGSHDFRNFKPKEITYMSIEILKFLSLNSSL